MKRYVTGWKHFRGPMFETEYNSFASQSDNGCMIQSYQTSASRLRPELKTHSHYTLVGWFCQKHHMATPVRVATLWIAPNPIPKTNPSGLYHAMTVMTIICNTHTHTHTHTHTNTYAQLRLQGCLHTELQIQECRSEMHQYVLWVWWEDLQPVPILHTRNVAALVDANNFSKSHIQSQSFTLLTRGGMGFGTIDKVNWNIYILSQCIWLPSDWCSESHWYPVRPCGVLTKSTA